MKKLISLLVVLSMLLCGVACAETAETVMYEPSYYMLEDLMGATIPAPENAAYEGTWIAFDSGLVVYHPNDLAILPLTEEQVAVNCFFNSITEDASLSYNISYTPVPEGTVLADQVESLSAISDKVEYFVLNDIEFITYDVADPGVTGLIMSDPLNWAIYTFTFGPLSNENLDLFLDTFIRSISVLTFEQAAE